MNTQTFTATDRKIRALGALIGHPGTPAAEVAAAERMLARLRATATAETCATWEPNWKGAKYEPGRHMPTVEIAKLVRAAIKVAVKIARTPAAPGEIAVPDALSVAPDSLKFGVRVPHYGSINITVKNIPADWGFTSKDPFGTGHYADYPSDALTALLEELKHIGNAWNYDNSDAMSDYFDRRYYLSADYERPAR